MIVRGCELPEENGRKPYPIAPGATAGWGESGWHFVIRTTIPERNRLTSDSERCPISLGWASEAMAICFPAASMALKVWRNSSWVAFLLARK